MDILKSIDLNTMVERLIIIQLPNPSLELKLGTVWFLFHNYTEFSTQNSPKYVILGKNYYDYATHQLLTCGIVTTVFLLMLIGCAVFTTKKCSRHLAVSIFENLCQNSKNCYFGGPITFV